MRHVLSSIALIVSWQLLAQAPVIGTAQFFQPGSTYIRDNFDPPPDFVNMLVQAAGPGYAIDLSPVNAMFLYSTEELTRVPANGPYFYFPEYYDTANVRLFVHQEQTDFGTFLFLSNADGIQYIGGQPNGVTWPMESVFMRYPNNLFPLELVENMTYGYTHQGNITGEWSDASGSDDHFVTGTYTMEADGYGAVQMPDGTLITNTLRLRTAIAYSDSNALFGVNAFNDTLYTWYAAGTSGPLMTLSRGSQALTAGYISFFPFAVYRPQAFTSIPGPALPVPQLVIVPVPATGPLHVHVRNGVREALLSILDQTGRIVRRSRMSGGEQDLEVSDLSPGMYRIIYHDTAHRIERPFVVMR